MKRDGLVQCAIGNDIEDRGEGFLVDNFQIMPCRSHAWPYIATTRKMRAVEGFAPIEDFATLFADPGQSCLHVFDGAAVDERSHERARFQWIPDAYLAIGFYEALRERLTHGFMHKDAARSSASLASGTDCAEEDCVRGQVQIGGRGNDDGVVAAKFEQGPAQPLGDNWTNAANHGRGTCGRG